MSGKSARLFQCRTRRDAKKLLTKFLFCEKKEIIVSTMAHTDGMEQRIRTNPLNREPNGSRSNLFLIIESLDCRSASQFLPGRIVPMLSIYIYIFFVIHTKKGEKEKQGNGFRISFDFSSTLPRFSPHHTPSAL